MYLICDSDNERMRQIAMNISNWFAFRLRLSVNDVMPDVIYLKERLENAERELNLLKTQLKK